MTVLTFPTNPTLGQQYAAPNGIQYVFDGVKWTVETVASSSAAVTNSVQDRVAPMFVTGDHTGIAFTYNAATNVMSADVTALVNGVHEFTLESTGATTFPTLTVPIEDNANPAGTGQVLKFSDSSQQAIIFGPVSTAGATSAQRVIIQGAPGYTGTTGEGGDVYVWAGPGGSTNGQGGDIKVRAGRGNGTGTGGYLNFQAGDSNTGNGGYINIESGSTGTYGSGGDITVEARSGGEITLRTQPSTGANNNWLFGTDGDLTLPVGGDILDSTGASVLGGGSTGNFTFKADRITNDNDNNASIVVGGGSPIENVVVDVVDQLVPPGGVWRMFFLDTDYLNLGTIVEVGDTVTTSWGTPITAAITNIVQDISEGTWALHFGQNITAGFNAGPKTVTFNRGPEVLLIPTSKTWTFGTNGDLTLPVGGDILDSNGDSVLGGGADTTVSYKGFKAVYARMYDDEPTISKVLIYQDTVTTTPTLEVDPSTDDDLFKVSGLANSSVIALVNIYGADNTHPTALSTLQHFAKSIIDNVILDNGDAGTNIDAYNMRTKFYDNFNDFASRAGERYKNFEFLRAEWSNISGTGGSGTGATFYLQRDPNDDVIDYADTNQKGINYQVGNVITILGATLGGTTPANNIVITVTEVGVGGRIDSFTYTGILPANLWPLDSISDGGSDQYDSANYIFTNIQGDSYAAGGPGVSEEAWAVNYNGGNVNESGAAWFGTGSEYVTTYNDSIFGLFVTGANINWIATNGNSGFDGDGIADTGSLQLVDTDGLINGDQSFVLNADGSVTFPDGTTQTTAYTEGDPNVWVQDFEPTAIGDPTDFVASANSVEYLSNGDIVAVFQHYYEDGVNGSHNTIGRFTPTGEKVWSMKFQGDVYTDGWGLAVNNNTNYIFLAGQKGGNSGYNSATLTKLDQADGEIIWSKTYDVGYNNSNVVVDVTSTDIVVVGYASNGTDNRIVTTKIHGGTGEVLWSKALNGQGNDEAYGMAVDNNNGGEVVTVGYIDTFGAQNAAATLYTDPASNPNWTTGANISGAGIACDVTFTGGVPTFTNIVDSTGGRTVDGIVATISGVSFGGTSPADDMVVKVGTLAANDTDDRMVVVKYDNTGAIQWQRAVQVEPGYDCRGADAAIDSDGNIYVCGNFDYDDGDDGTNQAMILIKFNNSGTKKWTRKVQGPCEDYASSVVVGPDNCLYLSAYTADGPDYSMVIAKYNLDGTVAWQRLLDSLTNWIFAGQFFFGPGGAGSTIAVRDGYVAVVGGVANFNVYTTPRAIIAQFGTDGKIFTRGDYDFKEATFSGLLNSTASNITVTDAGKVSSDYAGYAGAFTPGDFQPDFDLTSDLVGTVYRSVNAGNELVNGNYAVSLNANGSVTLPAGGTVSEGYVTSNPTIQLTPARPDVASQKLVIKGGGIPYYLENGIEVSVNNTIRTVGQTLEVDVNSNTYTSQTLYWWINPEGVGISDPESGTVTLNGSGYGSFSIVVDSDDYEFRVRVSPEDHNYGPGVIGAQSPLINSGEPTFNYEHHLHLTTGNLAETSILLGTDNHNVRTTTDGGIEITTETTTVNPPDTITITGADVAGVNLVYTRDLAESTPTWTSPVVNPATDPFIEFDVQWRIVAPEIDPLIPIYVNAGTLAKPFTQWSLNPPYGSTAPTGVYTYLTLDVHTWTFGIDGTVTFPTLTVERGDDPSNTITGQTLLFGDSTQEAIISTPNGTVANNSSQRLVINPGEGYNGGEGGDIYLWAGRGGDASGTGGDIKIRGGQGGANTDGGSGGDGGYIRIEAGDAASTGGAAGYVDIHGGLSTTAGGAVYIRTATTNTFNHAWQFANDGKLTAPGNLQVNGGKIILNTGGNAYVESVDYGVNSANSAVNIFGGPYQKIKLRAGFGTEATWTFGTDGKLAKLDGLTLTAGGQFNICTILTGGSGYNTGSALKATTGGSGTGMTVGIGYGLSNQLTNVDVVDPGTGYVDGDVITVSEGTGGTFTITRYNNQANQGNNNTVEFNWTFGTNGRLTLPGALVKSTVAKTGAILNANDMAFAVTAVDGSGVVTGITITNTPNTAWQNNGAGTGVVVGNISFNVQVDGSGNATVSGITSSGGHSTSETFTLGGASFGAGITPTALDLTKSVNKLTNGDYTLADGVEGQIMYLVRQTGSTAHNVTVANVRLDGTVYTDVSFTPFTDGIDPTNMATLIFTDSAWQCMSGVWSFT